MKPMRRTFNKFSQCLVLMVTVSVVCLYPASLSAQTSFWQRFRGWFGRGSGQIGDARGRSRGAAVRDPDLCPPTQTPLTALIPNRTEAILTSTDHPSFWFYIPYRPATELALEFKFVLQDDAFNDIYSEVFVIPEQTETGLVSLQLMAKAAALEMNKTYHWYFLAYCNDQQQVYEPAFVHGRIRREPLPQDFGTRNDSLESQTQFEAYAESRFWYEAFDTLALNVWTTATNPELADEWNQALEIIELKHLAQEPFIGRYQVLNTTE